MDATVARPARSRDAEGATVFARHAFAPNSLGYCGPAHSDSLFEYAVTGGNDSEVARLATEFSGAWPYLRLIARSAGIDDPLDRRVVEAYWIGSPLLERIEPVTFGEAVMERFKQQCGPRWGMVAEAIEAGASPHHNFHVFTVYPWLGMLMTGPVEQPLKVLDQCRIRWGEVEALAGDTAAIRSEPLEWRWGRLILGPERLETATVAVNGAAMVSDLRVGDWVSLHWHWVCDRLTRRQLSTLRYYTQRLLAIANGAVRSSGEATFSTRH
jgi:hypothetical protein